MAKNSGLIAMNKAMMPPNARPIIVPAAAPRQQLLFCAHNLAFQCLPRRDLARTEVTLVTWRLQQTAAWANLMSALGRKRTLAT